MLVLVLDLRLQFAQWTLNYVQTTEERRSEKASDVIFLNKVHPSVFLCNWELIWADDFVLFSQLAMSVIQLHSRVKQNVK